MEDNEDHADSKDEDLEDEPIDDDDEYKDWR